jgi:hypothetical protein
MEPFTQGLQSGALLEWVIALMAIEGVALTVWWLKAGRGIPPLDLSINLAAGATLMLAVRAGILGDFAQLAGLLALALLTHILDLSRRWRPRD